MTDSKHLRLLVVNSLVVPDDANPAARAGETRSRTAHRLGGKRLPPQMVINQGRDLINPSR